MTGTTVSYAGTTCSQCFREATVILRGAFRNGRRTVDFRCRDDAPLPAHVGTWLYHGGSDKSFRLAVIEPVQ